MIDMWFYMWMSFLVGEAIVELWIFMVMEWGKSLSYLVPPVCELPCSALLIFWGKTGNSLIVVNTSYRTECGYLEAELQHWRIFAWCLIKRTRDLFLSNLILQSCYASNPKKKMNKTTLALIDRRYLRNATIWPSLWTPTDMSWFCSYQDHLMSSWIQGGCAGKPPAHLAASYGWVILFGFVCYFCGLYPVYLEFYSKCMWVSFRTPGLNSMPGAVEILTAKKWRSPLEVFRITYVHTVFSKGFSDM